MQEDATKDITLLCRMFLVELLKRVICQSLWKGCAVFFLTTRIAGCALDITRIAGCASRGFFVCVSAFSFLCRIMLETTCMSSGQLTLECPLITIVLFVPSPFL